MYHEAYLHFVFFVKIIGFDYFLKVIYGYTKLCDVIFNFYVGPGGFVPQNCLTIEVALAILLYSKLIILFRFGSRNSYVFFLKALYQSNYTVTRDAEIEYTVRLIYKGIYAVQGIILLHHIT